MLLFVVEWRQNILFLTSELANKAEIYILSARDTTRAWVPGRGIMGNDERVYKTMYNTWLSPRLQNQSRSLARLIFPFTVGKDDVPGSKFEREPEECTVGQLKRRLKCRN